MTDQPKILLVDDEEPITDSLAPFLQRFGFTVEVAADGQEALDKVPSFEPELIVLDILMPRVDGRQVLRRLRREGDRRPIILLTKVGESTERALALEEGADDYINKPFDPFELLARIRAVLRRARPDGLSLVSSRRLASGELTLDRRTQRAYLSGEQLNLKPRAVALLEYMLTHPDEVLSRERLLDAVWGWDYPAGTRAVDSQVYELRRILNDSRDDPRYIETVLGQGYRFVGSVEVVP